MPKKIYIVFYFLLHAVPTVCSDENPKNVPSQAGTPVISKLLADVSLLLSVNQHAKEEALKELEQASKAPIFKKAPANKAEIDQFIQTHRAQNAECRRLQPIYGPDIIALATLGSDFAFWEEYTRLMEPLEAKK